MTELKSSHIQSIKKFENTYWWHKVRFCHALNAIIKYGKRKPLIYDMGSASCGLSKFLAERKISVIGVDNHEALIEQEMPFERHDLGKEFVLNQRADIITALDIIEHLKDPMFFFDNCYKNLNENGTIIVTAPAFNCLYSWWDEALGHKKRFTLNELKKIMASAGFQIVQQYYFFFLIFFPVLLRKIKKSGNDSFPEISYSANNLLFSLFNYELSMIKAGVRFPVGSSLFIAAKKR